MSTAQDVAPLHVETGGVCSLGGEGDNAVAVSAAMADVPVSARLSRTSYSVGVPKGWLFSYIFGD